MMRAERISVIAVAITLASVLGLALGLLRAARSEPTFTVCDVGCDMTPAYFDALLSQHSPGEQITLRRECAVNDEMDGIVCGQAKYRFEEE